MPEIPAPAHVLQALAPVWPSLYTALEWATQQTLAYFEAEGAPIDRHLAPSRPLSGETRTGPAGPCGPGGGGRGICLSDAAQ
jgi:hypothetical protein